MYLILLILEVVLQADLNLMVEVYQILLGVANQNLVLQVDQNLMVVIQIVVVFII